MYWDKYYNLIELINANPFYLVNNEDLYPFVEVANSITIKDFGTFMILVRYAIVETLTRIASEGNSCVSIADLDKRVKLLLRNTGHYLQGSIKPYLNYFNEDFHTDYHKGITGFKSYYEMEKVVKNFILDRIGKKSNLHFRRSYTAPLFLSNEQKAMVENYQADSIMVLTGGPGTGKSTTIKELVDRMMPNTKIAITAPTGKACVVLKSIVRGMENGVSCTTQKILGFGRVLTKEDIEELRSIDAFIVDETSMLDLYNMYTIATIFKDTNTTFIFSGDVHQLPSVDCGYILHDLVKLGVKTYYLTENHRSERTIVHNADSIINGKDDFIFDNEFELHDISEDPLSVHTDVLLTPYKTENKEGSSYYLNKRKQASLFGPLPNGQMYHAGDSIIFMRTNYKRGYINGETGRIVEIRPDVFVISKRNIEDGTYNLIEVENIEDINLAYAITVHKSQGSEYPVCGIVINEYNPFISKELLYTAVTRAKNKVVLWTTREILTKIVKTPYTQRMSWISKSAV